MRPIAPTIAPPRTVRPANPAGLLRAICAGSVLAGALCSGDLSAQEVRTAFRPCIDPANLPFADSAGQGFENRIAALFAQKLGLPVKSYPSPQRMNFVRNTLRYRLPGEDFRCDILMSVPAGFEQVANTIPYYRSTYVLVYPKGHGLDDVHSGSDFFALPAERRSRLRVGIHDKSPAAAALVKHGWEHQVVLYRMLSPDPDDYPGAIIEKELARGAIDAAIVWGPVGGYYAKVMRNVPLEVIPLRSEPGVKFDYAIAMGVRYGEPDWKAAVEKLIADNRPAIVAILRDYGVPLVNERGDPLDDER